MELLALNPGTTSRAIIMRLADLLSVFEQLAPVRYAEPWDNVGLLAGDPAQKVRRVMLTIDFTPNVAREAIRNRCDCVVSYHPPIFQAIKQLTVSHPVYEAIRRGIAIYSPHTAMDVAEGGTNDILADTLGLQDRAPLRIATSQSTHCKLVTFVPQSAVEKVSQALFYAGAGHIGQYSSCSFRTEGTGTFYGEENTNPTVGRRGRLEQVPEIRLETLVPLAAVADVIRAMRKAHPYEEPAFDLVSLTALPADLGLGRIGTLSPSVSRPALLHHIKQKLGLQNLLIAGPTAGAVRRAAVAAGACGDLIDEALLQKADLILTGEMRHHDALHAANAGMTVVCTLHSNSERIALKYLNRNLQRKLPTLKFILSRADHDPFVIQ